MVILVTGFAGTLGAAFTSYLLSQGHSVVGIDASEWAVAAFPNHAQLTKRLGDFATAPYFGIFDTVIHCAAYKHVDLAENNLESLIENNITKVYQFYRALNGHTKDLIFISSDKAVEPISAYGYTKALIEKLTFSTGGKVARLGNILNSTGSAIPLWESQIANKEPITITSESMIRYVIEVEDAVHQIWAGFLAGEKLIIPEMGPPRRIMDILADVLARHGFTNVEEYPGGVSIVGIRAAEKLEERLRWPWEEEQK